MNEDRLHELARYYMYSMREKMHIKEYEELSLDEFLDKYSLPLTMQDLYLGQSILNLFDRL
jgi:hypothetical protein